MTNQSLSELILLTNKWHKVVIASLPRNDVGIAQLGKSSKDNVGRLWIRVEVEFGSCRHVAAAVRGTTHNDLHTHIMINEEMKKYSATILVKFSLPVLLIL